MKRIRTATFRGKRYRIRVLPGSKMPQDTPFGGCDSPTQDSKTIWLRNDFDDPQEGLDCAIHEGLHACLWDLDEEAVASTATDLARLLWRLGYRLG